MSKLIAIITFKKVKEPRRLEVIKTPVAGTCFTDDAKSTDEGHVCALYNEEGCDEATSVCLRGFVFKEVK